MSPRSQSSPKELQQSSKIQLFRGMPHPATKREPCTATPIGTCLLMLSTSFTGPEGRAAVPTLVSRLKRLIVSLLNKPYSEKPNIIWHRWAGVAVLVSLASVRKRASAKWAVQACGLGRREIRSGHLSPRLLGPVCCTRLSPTLFDDAIAVMAEWSR